MKPMAAVIRATCWRSSSSSPLTSSTAPNVLPTAVQAEHRVSVGMVMQVARQSTRSDQSGCDCHIPLPCVQGRIPSGAFGHLKAPVEQGMFCRLATLGRPRAPRRYGVRRKKCFVEHIGDKAAQTLVGAGWQVIEQVHDSMNLLNSGGQRPILSSRWCRWHVTALGIWGSGISAHSDGIHGFLAMKD